MRKARLARSRSVPQKKPEYPVSAAASRLEPLAGCSAGQGVRQDYAATAQVLPAHRQTLGVGGRRGQVCWQPLCLCPSFVRSSSVAWLLKATSMSSVAKSGALRPSRKHGTWISGTLGPPTASVDEHRQDHRSNCRDQPSCEFFQCSLCARDSHPVRHSSRGRSADRTHREQ